MPTISRRRLQLYTTVVLILAVTSNLRAKETLQDRVDRLVQPYLDNDVVMGMSLGVIQRGEQLAVGYGRLAKTDTRRPDGDTVYEIGSISKVFTGLLLADAVERGLVKLDQLASELLPDDVKMPKHDERPITLQDLATHVSGLPRLPDQFRPADWSNPYADYTTDQLYAFLNRHQLRRAPGEKGEYSNLGAGLLGHLLALESEQTYEQLLLDRIAEPLEMNNTTITLNKKSKARLAPPHTADRQSAANWDIPTLAGAGAIRSTINDMLRLANAQLAPPENELGKAIELAWKTHQQPIDTSFAMGLGWHVARDGSTRWHNGQTGGYHSMMLVSRDVDAAVVLLTNTATREVDQLAEDIMRMLAGAKVEPRVFETEIEVADEVMQRYVGEYKLTPGVIFSVTVEDGKLMVGVTDQPSLQVFARSETEWFYKVVVASITFRVDDDGKCRSLEILQNGVRQKAQRIEKKD